MVRRLGLALLALVLEAGALSGQRTWSPDERSVVGAFGAITAIATTRDRVYVVTADGVLPWDPQGRRWEAPWEPPANISLARVTAALADDLDGSLWLVRSSGWVRFDPGLNQWEQGGVAGQVSDAALDGLLPGSGLFLRTNTGWSVAQRGGFLSASRPPQRPIRPTSVAQLLRTVPAIQASNAMIQLPGRGRPVRLTAAARADGFLGLGWFVGTDGAGLLYYPDGAALPELIPLGLPAAQVQALFAGIDGVWAATPRTATADPSVSFVASDLGRYDWVQGPFATGLRFSEVRRMVGRDGDLWLATDIGAVRVRPKDDDARVFDELRGLPDSRVVDVAQRKGRIAAGTMHGIAIRGDSGGFTRVAPDFSGYAAAVEMSGDTVWVGTDLGLFAAVPEEGDLRQPAALAASLTLRAAVVDLAWRGDTLVALTRERLLWRDPGNGEFTAGPLLGAGLGTPHTVVSGGSGVYVAGDRGVVFTPLAGPARRTLAVGAELPGRVNDLAVDQAWLWVATDAGLVRLARRLAGE